MPDLYIGLMSGTSLDGIDAVLADLSAAPRLIHARHESFPEALRESSLALTSAGSDELHRAATAANSLAEIYARVVLRLLEDASIAAAEVTAIGCHGQTVRHNPAAGYTIQLVNAALLVERCNIDVVCDFRNRDIAVGGQGAPLVPAFHHAIFHSRETTRAIVNIGGMANVTLLDRGGVVAGFDSGPGNVLMDGWISAHRGKPYDENGAWAGQGQVIAALLESLLADPYFASAPPKSTGREAFNLDWLRGHLKSTAAAVDVQATLLELTAKSIAGAIDSHCAGVEEIYVCGGGARNPALVTRLQQLCGDRSVQLTDTLGVDAEWVEALAFAWLAQRTLRREPGNVPAVTGAAGPRVLGAVYPR